MASQSDSDVKNSTCEESSNLLYDPANPLDDDTPSACSSSQAVVKLPVWVGTVATTASSSIPIEYSPPAYNSSIPIPPTVECESSENIPVTSVTPDQIILSSTVPRDRFDCNTNLGYSDTFDSSDENLSNYDVVSMDSVSMLSCDEVDDDTGILKNYNIKQTENTVRRMSIINSNQLGEKVADTQVDRSGGNLSVPQIEISNHNRSRSESISSEGSSAYLSKVMNPNREVIIHNLTSELVIGSHSDSDFLAKGLANFFSELQHVMCLAVYSKESSKTNFNKNVLLIENWFAMINSIYDDVIYKKNKTTLSILNKYCHLVELFIDYFHYCQKEAKSIYSDQFSLYSTRLEVLKFYVQEHGDQALKDEQLGKFIKKHLLFIKKFLFRNQGNSNVKNASEEGKTNEKSMEKSYNDKVLDMIDLTFKQIDSPNFYTTLEKFSLDMLEHFERVIVQLEKCKADLYTEKCRELIRKKIEFANWKKIIKKMYDRSAIEKKLLSSTEINELTNLKHKFSSLEKTDHLIKQIEEIFKRCEVANEKIDLPDIVKETVYTESQTFVNVLNKSIRKSTVIETPLEKSIPVIIDSNVNNSISIDIEGQNEDSNNKVNAARNFTVDLNKNTNHRTLNKDSRKSDTVTTSLKISEGFQGSTNNNNTETTPAELSVVLKVNWGEHVDCVINTNQSFFNSSACKNLAQLKIREGHVKSEKTSRDCKERFDHIDNCVVYTLQDYKVFIPHVRYRDKLASPYNQLDPRLKKHKERLKEKRLNTDTLILPSKINVTDKTMRKVSSTSKSILKSRNTVVKKVKRRDPRLHKREAAQKDKEHNLEQNTTTNENIKSPNVLCEDKSAWSRIPFKSCLTEPPSLQRAKPPTIQYGVLNEQETETAMPDVIKLNTNNDLAAQETAPNAQNYSEFGHTLKVTNKVSDYGNIDTNNVKAQRTQPECQISEKSGTVKTIDLATYRQNHFERRNSSSTVMELKPSNCNMNNDDVKNAGTLDVLSDSTQCVSENEKLTSRTEKYTSSTVQINFKEVNIKNKALLEQSKSALEVKVDPLSEATLFANNNKPIELKEMERENEKCSSAMVKDLLQSKSELVVRVITSVTKFNEIVQEHDKCSNSTLKLLETDVDVNKQSNFSLECEIRSQKEIHNVTVTSDAEKKDINRQSKSFLNIQNPRKKTNLVINNTDQEVALAEPKSGLVVQKKTLVERVLVEEQAISHAVANDKKKTQTGKENDKSSSKKILSNLKDGVKGNEEYNDVKNIEVITKKSSIVKPKLKCIDLFKEKSSPTINKSANNELVKKNTIDTVSQKNSKQKILQSVEKSADQKENSKKNSLYPTQKTTFKNSISDKNKSQRSNIDSKTATSIQKMKAESNHIRNIISDKGMDTKCFNLHNSKSNNMKHTIMNSTYLKAFRSDEKLFECFVSIEKNAQKGRLTKQLESSKHYSTKTNSKKKLLIVADLQKEKKLVFPARLSDKIKKSNSKEIFNTESIRCSLSEKHLCKKRKETESNVKTVTCSKETEVSLMKDKMLYKSTNKVTNKDKDNIKVAASGDFCSSVLGKQTIYKAKVDRDTKRISGYENNLKEVCSIVGELQNNEKTQVDNSNKDIAKSDNPTKNRFDDNPNNVKKVFSAIVDKESKEKGQVVNRSKEKAMFRNVSKEKAKVDERTQEKVEVVNLSKEKAEVDERAKERVSRVVNLSKEKVEVVNLSKEKSVVDERTKERVKIVNLSKEKAEVDERTEEKVEVDERTEEKVEVDERTGEKVEVDERTEERVKIVNLSKEKAEVDERTKEKVEVDERTEEKAEVDERAKEKAEVDERTQEKVEVVNLSKEKAEVDERAKERVSRVVNLSKEKVEVVNLSKEKFVVDERTKERVKIVNLSKEKAEVDERTEEKVEVDERTEEKVEVDERTGEKVEVDERTEERVKIVNLSKEKAEVDERTKEKVEVDERSEEKAEVDERAKEKAEVDERTEERVKIVNLSKEKAEVDERTEEKVMIVNLSKEKVEVDDLSKEKVEVDDRSKDKSEVDERTKEKVEVVNLSKEKVEVDERAKERVKVVNLSKEKAEVDNLSKDKSEFDERTKEKVEVVNLSKEKVEVGNLSKEKLEVDNQSKGKAEVNNRGKEKAVVDKISDKNATLTNACSIVAEIQSFVSSILNNKKKTENVCTIEDTEESSIEKKAFLSKINLKKLIFHSSEPNEVQISKSVKLDEQKCSINAQKEDENSNNQVLDGSKDEIFDKNKDGTKYNNKETDMVNDREMGSNGISKETELDSPDQTEVDNIKEIDNDKEKETVSYEINITQEIEPIDNDGKNKNLSENGTETALNNFSNPEFDNGEVEKYNSTNNNNKEMEMQKKKLPLNDKIVQLDNGENLKFDNNEGIHSHESADSESEMDCVKSDNTGTDSSSDEELECDSSTETETEDFKLSECISRVAQLQLMIEHLKPLKEIDGEKVWNIIKKDVFSKPPILKPIPNVFFGKETKEEPVKYVLKNNLENNSQPTEKPSTLKTVDNNIPKVILIKKLSLVSDVSNDKREPLPIKVHLRRCSEEIWTSIENTNTSDIPKSFEETNTITENKKLEQKKTLKGKDASPRLSFTLKDITYEEKQRYTKESRQNQKKTLIRVPSCSSVSPDSELVHRVMKDTDGIIPVRNTSTSCKSKPCPKSCKRKSNESNTNISKIQKTSHDQLDAITPCNVSIGSMNDIASQPALKNMQDCDGKIKRNKGKFSIENFIKNDR